jgi:hypothetical protein
MTFDDSFHLKLASMLERIVDREICDTREMPAVVDVMVKHEEILSCVDGLARSRQLSEFDVAYGNWQARRRVDVAETATLPAFFYDGNLGGVGSQTLHKPSRDASLPAELAGSARDGSSDLAACSMGAF